MSLQRILLGVASMALPAWLAAQGLDPAALLKPPTDAWPTYNGDYSGRRFSPLTEINASNVHTLSLAWAARFSGGTAGIQIKSTPLMVNGVLYFTSPNHVWAADARTGREIWHYQYPPNTGSTIGNRGVGMYGDWLFFESPDSNLVSLDARTGRERWKVRLADPKLDYTSTVAPVVIRNHVIAGIGGDHLDNPGFIQSHDPETGALQWRWWTTPRAGEPGIETWPDEYAAAHGTGQAWIPGTYDPELNLYIVGTGNPNPVMAEKSRKGDNLHTCSIVALNPDTGKLVWYFQPSPHDVHDWDAVETPVLVDGLINGQRRKLVVQASRNGYLFVLDRVTGKQLLTAPFIETLNWSKDLDAKGRPIPDPDKFPRADGTLVSPASGGATNWQAPSFSPDTGLFYVGSSRSYSMYYLTDIDPRPQGWGGVDQEVGNIGGAVLALDYRTGKIVWRHDWPSGSGLTHMLTTAGRLLFTHNGNNVIAFDPANGKILWHSTLMAAPSAGPITYLVDGKQYLLICAGDSLYAFTVNRASISAAPQAPLDVEAVMVRIGERVAGYYRQTQRVLFIESSTVQPIGSNWTSKGFARTVESELRIESEAADGFLLPGANVMRDVRKINGKAPRERDKNARSGCTDPNPLSPEPLSFLLPAHRGEYRFTSVRDGKEQGRAALVIDFMSANRESRAELIEDERGHDDCFDWSGPLATRGRVWVDPNTHDVLRVDRRLDGLVDVRVPPALQRRYGFGPWVVLERDDQTVRYKAVTFRDPDEVIRLPESGESMTVLRGGLQSMRRTDSFSDFRRFLGTGRVKEP